MDVEVAGRVGFGDVVAVVVDDVPRSPATDCRWCRAVPVEPVRQEDVQRLGRTDAVEDG